MHEGMCSYYCTMMYYDDNTIGAPTAHSLLLLSLFFLGLKKAFSLYFVVWESVQMPTHACQFTISIPLQCGHRLCKLESRWLRSPTYTGEFMPSSEITSCSAFIIVLAMVKIRMQL